MKGGGGDIVTAVALGVKLHPYTKQAFETWAANIAQDSGILAGSKNTEEKIKELEGGPGVGLNPATSNERNIQTSNRAW